jgi:hypothetical protein
MASRSRQIEPLDATKPMLAATPFEDDPKSSSPGTLTEPATDSVPARGPESAAGPQRSGGSEPTAEFEPRVSEANSPPRGGPSPADWSAASLGLPALAPRGSGSDGAGSDGSGSDGSGSRGSGHGGSGHGGSGHGGSGHGGSGHADSSTGWSRRRIGTTVGVAAALAALIGGGTYYFAHSSRASAVGATGKAKQKRKVVTTAAKGPEHVLSVSPTDGATGVNGGAAIRVVFSEPLSATTPMPTLHPKISGSWHVAGNAAMFVPTKGFWEHTKVTLTIPGGALGVQSGGGGLLASKVVEHYTTGYFSEVRLEQDLAQLGYLPLTWAPTSGTPAAMTDANAQYSAAYAPPQGSYTWQSGYPSRLMNLWRPDGPSEILRGAVAAFQADHGLIYDMQLENEVGLIVNGSIGQQTWSAMFRALANGDMNKHGYTYAVASQHYPETLTVWHNGAQIFHRLANTGIPISPTAVRTDPVYIRYQYQIMKGTNPDGTKYADPVAWVAYFHGGEAVHYFPRYSYGSQQSLGCVELPYNQAKWIWPYLTYGTLVTVTKV